MQISKEILVPHRTGEDKGVEWRSFRYAEHDGLVLIERSNLEGESDFFSTSRERVSSDNGRTWGPWRNVYGNFIESDPATGDEIEHQSGYELWNPVHKHYVGSGVLRYYVGGHEEAYRRHYSVGEPAFYDHHYVWVRGERDAEPKYRELLRYEDGPNFDPAHPRDPAFFRTNLSYNNPPILLKSGDFAVPMSPTIAKCCELAGLDVGEVFPSSPELQCGVIVARGHWNETAQRYDFTFSKPIVISDLLSSRGLDEPALAELDSGRLILVMRGSNVQSDAWRTRIAAGAPSYKWFAASDDGGKTFSPVAPWTFDDGEPVGSSATVSHIMRSEKTGRHWWFGNITGTDARGNMPRHPLHTGMIDETTGCLIRDSVVVIDDRAPGESDDVQLSNFGRYQDRETGELVLTLAKIGQFNGETWQGDTIRYRLSE